MEGTGSIDTYTIDWGRYMLRMFGLLYGLLFIAVFIGIKFNLPSISTLSIVVTVVVVFLLDKKIKRYFTKKAKVYFCDAYFLIELSNINTDAFLRKDTINYKEVQCFTAIDKKGDKAVLKLYLKNGQTLAYNFTHQKYKDKQNIVTVFFQYIKAYNLSGPESVITIKQGFFTSSSTLYSNIAVALLWSVVIIIDVHFIPQLIPATSIPFIFFYAVFFEARRNYKNQVKRLLS